MADKDLHLSNATIRESGTDQLHLANGVGVMQFVTFTEDDPPRIASELFYYLAAGGDYNV